LKQKVAAQTDVVQRNNQNEMQTMAGESHEEIQAFDSAGATSQRG
jgi:hypothetical protein